MCLYPKPMVVETGKRAGRYTVPCKRCWQCIERRIDGVVGRALCEQAVSDWTAAVTLTYRPRNGEDQADKVIYRYHFQQFVRSLRKRGHKVRYVAVAECGELKGRVHFHAVLFGIGKPLALPQKKRCWHDAWPHGHMYVDHMPDSRAMRYVCKYLFKQTGSKSVWKTYSKKPPIGWPWFAKKADLLIDAGVYPTTFEYLPPGAHPGKRYFMTGATRRDFVKRVRDGLRAEGVVGYPENLNPYLEDAFEKYDTEDVESEKENESFDVVMRELHDKLDAARWSERRTQSYLLNLYSEFDSKLHTGFWTPTTQEEADRCQEALAALPTEDEHEAVVRRSRNLQLFRRASARVLSHDLARFPPLPWPRGVFPLLSLWDRTSRLSRRLSPVWRLIDQRTPCPRAAVESISPKNP